MIPSHLYLAYKLIETQGGRLLCTFVALPLRSTTINQLLQDPVNPTVTLAQQSATPAAVTSISSAHSTWWANYWGASCVLLPSSDPFPVLQKYWYGAQYLMAMSSRAGKVPPGLWGPFITNDGPGWNGDYTLNYNCILQIYHASCLTFVDQAPYYGVFSSNHPELIFPYFDPILQWVPNGRKMAAQFG